MRNRALRAIGCVSRRQAHLIPAVHRRAAAGLAVPLRGAEIPGAHRYPVESVICGGWMRCTVVTIQKCHEESQVAWLYGLFQRLVLGAVPYIDFS